MAAYWVVVPVAFLASALTLFSGFGLGTLLMPAFALFFPLELAVAATALVHAANNTFKLPLFVRDANRAIVLRFGLPAIVAALIGAGLLGLAAELPPIVSYSIRGREAVVTPIKLVMGFLIFGFALFELLPRFRNVQFDPKWLTLGGVLSGFFGGLSGHQGALRAAFLAKAGLAPSEFVGSSAVISFLVDATRLLVYGVAFLEGGGELITSPEHGALVLLAIVAAFSGVLVGKRYVKKVTMKTIQLVSGLLLMLVALGLGAGLL